MKIRLAVILASLALTAGVRADLINSLIDNTTAQKAAAALPQDQVVQGLKEALSKGVQNAISRLGHDGGFLTNMSVKIQIPDKLKSVEKALRAAKQDTLADDVITTMNHAAELAIPEAASVFGDAVSSMSIDDAKSILSGSTNAATLYFQKKTRGALQQKFAPIVKASTDKAGATAAYKKFISKAGDYTSSFGSFGSFASNLTKTESLDIDAYVTGKALDGLFKMIAIEEAAIRQNPAARTTDLLQKVFGAVAK
ncbi:MAG: DUF4197 domain-containing protein [Limisphaerales bacterium]